MPGGRVHPPICPRHRGAYEYIYDTYVYNNRVSPVWRCASCVAEAKASVRRAQEGYRRVRRGLACVVRPGTFGYVK